MTPSHGQEPQAPLIGSQQAPLGQVGAVHWLSTQVGGLCVSSQTLPTPQGGSQVGTHSPSLQALPLSHMMPAQVATQVWLMKSSLGLQASPGWQVVGVQGFWMHAPVLSQTSLQA